MDKKALITKVFISLTFIMLSFSYAYAGSENVENAKSKLCEDYFKVALRHYDKGEYAVSAELFREILSLNPDFKPAGEYLVKVNGILNNDKAAIEKSLNKAQEYLLNNEFEKSKTEFNFILKHDPDNQSAKEGYAKAEKLLQKKIRDIAKINNQNKINKLNDKAAKYLKNGDKENAKATFEEMLILDPENQNAKDYISRQGTGLKDIAALHVNGLYSQALECYINGNYPEAIKYFENTTQAALKYFEAIVLTPPLRLDTLDFIEECKRKIIENEQKVENMAKEEIKKRVLETIARSEKFFANGYYKVSMREIYDARNLALRNGITEFDSQISELYEKNLSSFVDNQLTTGDEYMDVKDYESAAQAYNEVLKFDPSNDLCKKKQAQVYDLLADRYYQEGINSFTMGNNDEARKAFERSLFYQPAKKEASRALERLK
jgi:tetratricopeptide (TPR) repeat protein